MKRFIPAFLLLLALLVGYWAWPFFGLRALAAALQARDVTAINEDVDYARVRRSFTEQIIGAYLHVTGRASKLGAFGSVATAIGASIVDPWVSQIVNPENLAELLRGGTISSELGPVSFKFGELPSSLNVAWSAWLSSQYGLGHFSIWLPPWCRRDQPVSHSDAAITVALESNRNRPARETARSDCGRTGKEISVNLRRHFAFGQVAHPRYGAAHRARCVQAAGASGLVIPP